MFPKCSGLDAGALRMPFAYPEPWDVKRRVVERVRAGATLKVVEGEVGMPTAGTVLAWARADPCFRADLSEAMARGRWLRVYAFDAGKAEVLLARMRAGEGVHDIVGTPGAPSWT